MVEIVLKIDDVLTGVAAEGISNTNSQVKASGVKKNELGNPFVTVRLLPWVTMIAHYKVMSIRP